MAYSATTGPPSLDATHAWTPAVGTGVTLNARITDPATFPWIKVDRITGWRSLPEAEDNRVPRTYGTGEIVYPSRLLGKTITYEGRVLAKSREDVHTPLHTMLQAFGASMDAEGLMTVTPYTAPGGVVWTYHARVLSLTPDQAWQWFPRRVAQYQWGWQLNMRLSDPFFYDNADDPYL